MVRVACTLIASAVACSEAAGEPRTAFLINAISDDNQTWLERAPDALAGKYRKMATRDVDFLRGTAGVYWRDVSSGGPGAAGSVAGDAGGAWLWIVGDAHLENLGTFRGADGVLAVDWNDLDAARFAPWWLDLRRMAVSIALAADELELGSGGDRAMVEAAARAYVEEIARAAAGGERQLVDDRAGEAVAELLEGAAEAGDEGRALATYTAVRDGQRVMALGDVTPPRDDGVWTDTTIAVDEREATTIAAAVARWRATTIEPIGADAAAIKGVSRRLGAGVASYAVPRYYVLVEGPTAAVDDDVLLELKEALPAPTLMVHAPPGLPIFTGAGERVVVAQRTLGARIDADPLLGHAEVAPISYRVRERTGYQRGLDLADVAHDRAAAIGLATAAGRLLAAAHAFAPVPGDDGARGVDRIAPRLVGRGEALVTETLEQALAGAAVVRDDARRFRAALEEHGPLLGAEPRE